MERNSPVSEFIMNPICKKIFNKINNFNVLLQTSFIFYFISIYYLINNDIEKASLIYLLSFIPYYEYEKHNQDFNIIFLLINLFIIGILSKKKNFNITFIFPVFFIILIILVSFSIKYYGKNKNTLKLDKLANQLCLKIYPNDDNTKIYHFNNFWNLFDFSFLTILIYTLISSS